MGTSMQQSGCLSLQRDPHSIAIALLAFFALLHLGLDWYLGAFSHLMLSALFWLATLLQTWDKRYQVKPRLGSSRFVVSIALSIGLILIGFYRRNGNIASFFPFFSFLAWVIGVYGPQSLSFYRKELLMVLCLGLPKFANDKLINIAPLTAGAVYHLLLYTGHMVEKRNLQIILPEGSIQVVPECSGLVLMIYMVSISVIFLGSFSLSRKLSCFLVLLGIAVGFVANAIRVSILAVLATPQSWNTFKYWHGNQGASFFVLGAMLSYAVLSYFIVRIFAQRNLKV
jgi:cyanoexosortase A